MAALSYARRSVHLTYSGKDAWEKLWMLSPDKDQFETVSPKWAIVPYKSQ
jgi:hypothetical protein